MFSAHRVEKELASVALMFLTPPTISTDVKRLFSMAGDIITKERSSMNPENAEKLFFRHENMPVVNFVY